MLFRDQVVEKRHERSQDKAKFDEIAEFMSINEHFEENFNAVLTSAIVFQQPVVFSMRKRI
jgi:Sec-independent protein secretion pathway component TatC